MSAIRSMTGFGRYEQAQESGGYAVEIKSVNNRFLDMQIRLPRVFSNAEIALRKLLTERLERGSVSLNLSWVAPASGTTVTYEPVAAGQYVAVLEKLASDFNLGGRPTISDLTPFLREFITQESATFNEAELLADLLPVVNGAIDQLLLEQEREGAYAVSDLLLLVAGMESDLALVKERAPERLTRFKERMARAVSDLQGEGVDETRIAFEISLMAEKLDIAEEISRLSGHLGAVRELFAQGGAVGKRFGFLLQEINRECNTIGSKSNDPALTGLSVSLKEAGERLREQSLNLL